MSGPYPPAIEELRPQIIAGFNFGASAGDILEGFVASGPPYSEPPENKQALEDLIDECEPIPPAIEAKREEIAAGFQYGASSDDIYEGYAVEFEAERDKKILKRFINSLDPNSASLD
jgi:hypothetical protein